MSEAPRVAVVIPTYNHARYLPDALDSVFRQTARAHEVVVVDDGSRDDPAEVVARYPDVQLIRQENQGLAAARNTGWRATTSERLVFLDADDRLKPDAIAHNLALFDSAPACGFVYGAHTDVFASTGEERPVLFQEPGPDPFAGFLRGNRIGMHATVMYSRSVLEALDGFDPTLKACEDYDLYLRITLRYPVACHSHVLAEYVRHDQNMSRNTGLMLRSALDVLHRQRDTAEQRPEWREAFQEGEESWTRFYANQWWTSIGQARGLADIADLLRQARTIATVQPGALPSALLRRKYRFRQLRRWANSAAWRLVASSRKSPSGEA